MATENSTLPVSEEHLNSSVVEDTQNNSVPADGGETNAAVADDTGVLTQSRVDFADEDAALAAENAGLDLGEASPEEEAAGGEAAGSDLAGKSKEELLAIFAKMLEERPVQSLRRDVEALKIAFYKLRRAESDAARRAFVEAGGAEGDFVSEPDPAELRFKDLFREYRRLRDEFVAGLEAAKEENLKIKLVMKDLWETYNLHVENFYNFIKINKELRDLDLKKNYEQKLALCEQAEALVLEPSIVEAFHKLQKLHDEWREIGPVANEYKEVLWNRFKEASSRINKQHQEFFENIKQEQLRNLELKSELCVKAEELAQQPLTSRKEWNKASEKLFEIQKVWKTIGFAPKKDNNAIYERFRNACDKFFEAKRTYYAGLKGEMEHNLQLKTELCEAAEALRDSEEWKKTTDELIALQAKWKQTGAVSRRYSDQIWKRFRAACDAFFERKSRHFAAVDDQYGENLRRKEALLEEMAAADILAGGFEMIRDFQRRWGEIGFVPIKQKEAIQKRYKEVVDKMFDTLRSSERDRSMDRFKEKVSSLKATGDRRLRTERDRLYNKVRQLEQDIALLENNIGFFSKSKNAEAMIAEVRAKIERAKQEMQAAIEKVKLIDQEENKE